MDVAQERIRQIGLWGNSQCEPLPLLAILMEEIGEVAKALNEEAPTNHLYTELIQVAAVAVKFASTLNSRPADSFVAQFSENELNALLKL